MEILSIKFFAVNHVAPKHRDFFCIQPSLNGLKLCGRCLVSYRYYDCQLIFSMISSTFLVIGRPERDASLT